MAERMPLFRKECLWYREKRNRQTGARGLEKVGDALECKSSLQANKGIETTGRY